ncbi:MAG: pyrroline-5-carboxylate reductase [Pseudohongiellaceae bacterium]
MKNTNIGFIGAGNMAGSLIQGLLGRSVPARNLWACDIDAARVGALETRYGINVSTASDIATRVDLLVLAVKPQVMETVCLDLRESLENNHCAVLSIAAGITLARLQGWLGNSSVIRCMPNTPALVGKGASALYAGASVSPAQRDQAEQTMSAVGLTVWLPCEADLDAVTALSGSGPAYFFLLMESMQETARSLGLSEETAHMLTCQTAAGAAELAASSDMDMATLRQQVTSPGGTTEAAINQLEGGGFRQLVHQALTAAYKRSQELAKQ